MNRPARKRFGQNFLTDQDVIEKIATAIAAREGDLIIEIGPGRAALTDALLQSGADVLAIEIDRDLARDLEVRYAGNPNFNLHCADALQVAFGELARGRAYRLVGNLPYNISTPLIFHILEQSPLPVDMYFMLQKEVVTRMAAGPGSKDFGRLSVMVQNLCEVDGLFNIGPESFDPSPRVESRLVRLTPRPQPQSGQELEDPLDRIVRKAFMLRRKTLRNSLSGLLTSDQIEAAGIDPSIRAEQLQMTEFLALARQLHSAESSK